MAIVVRILCQHKQKMRYLNSSRDYVCDSSDHSSWKCRPTFRWVSGEITPIGEGKSLPKGVPTRR